MPDTAPLAGRTALVILNVGIGNRVILAPVLRAVRVVSPGFRYGLLGSRVDDLRFAAAIAVDGEIDAVPPLIWRRFAPSARADMLAYMRGHGIDLLINLRKEDPARDGNYFAFRQVCRDAGIECWDLHELDDTRSRGRMVDQIAAVFRGHGVDIPAIEPDWLGALRTPPAEPVVGFFAGASKGVKRWPAARWVDVASALRATGVTARIEVTGGRSAKEVRLVEDIAAGADAVPVDLPRLDDLLAWTAGLSLLVTCDTAAAHLAGALGCPVVGVYFSTLASIWGPYAAPENAVALQSPIGAACRAMKVDGTCARLALGCPAPCRHGITTSMVTEAVHRHLGSDSWERARP